MAPPELLPAITDSVPVLGGVQAPRVARPSGLAAWTPPARRKVSTYRRHGRVPCEHSGGRVHRFASDRVIPIEFQRFSDVRPCLINRVQPVRCVRVVLMYDDSVKGIPVVGIGLEAFTKVAFGKIPIRFIAGYVSWTLSHAALFILGIC